MSAEEPLIGSSRTTSFSPETETAVPTLKTFSNESLINYYEFIFSILENKFPPLSCDLNDIPIIDQMGQEYIEGRLPKDPKEVSPIICCKNLPQALVVYGHLHYLQGNKQTAFDFYRLSSITSLNEDSDEKMSTEDGLFAEGFFHELEYIQMTTQAEKDKQKLSAFMCYETIIEHDNPDGYAALGRFQMKLGLEDRGRENLTKGMLEGSLWARFEMESRNFRDGQEESVFEIRELAAMGFQWATVFLGKYLENAKDFDGASEQYFEVATKGNSCALLFFAQKNLTEIGNKHPLIGDPEETLIYRQNYYFHQMKKFVTESGFIEDSLKVQLLNKYNFFEERVKFPPVKIHMGNYFPLPDFTPIVVE